MLKSMSAMNVTLLYNTKKKMYLSHIDAVKGKDKAFWTADRDNAGDWSDSERDIQNTLDYLPEIGCHDKIVIRRYRILTTTTEVWKTVK